MLSSTFGIMAAVVAVCAIAMFIILVRSAFRAHGFARKSGLSDLIAQYLAHDPPDGARLAKQSIGVGTSWLRESCTVHVGRDGLYVLVRTETTEYAPILVPWPELAAAQEETIDGTRCVRFSVGVPTVGTLSVPHDLFSVIRPMLADDRAWPPLDASATTQGNRS